VPTLHRPTARRGPATVTWPFPCARTIRADGARVLSPTRRSNGFKPHAKAPTCCRAQHRASSFADSKMNSATSSRSVDLDTKAQAIEGAPTRASQGARRQDGRARQGPAGQESRCARRGPLDIEGGGGGHGSSETSANLAPSGARQREGEEGPARIHCSGREASPHIKTKKGFTYGGKEDPVAPAFAQGEWPRGRDHLAVGPTRPLVAGDCEAATPCTSCRCDQRAESYGRGRSLSAITCPEHPHVAQSGPSPTIILALGTPWDEGLGRPPGIHRWPSSSANATRRHAAASAEDELELPGRWRRPRPPRADSSSSSPH